MDSKAGKLSTEMIIPPGEAEGNSGNRHRGANQWLYVVFGTGSALINGQRYPLRPGTLLLIEHRDTHEIKNTGHESLRTLNIYVPPAYTENSDELPPAKP